MPFSWTDLLAPAIGGTAALLGGKMQNNAANKGNERQWDLLQQEMQRRNMLQGMAAPSLLRAIGYRNPQQIGQMQSQISGQQSPMSTPGQGNAMIPQTAQSGASKGLGIAGTALGAAGLAGGAGMLGSLGTPAVAGMSGATAAGGIPGALGLGGGSGLLGLGAATIPVVGGLLAGGAYAANKIGQGRRTANSFVDAVEQPYGETLKKLSAGGGSLQDLNAADQNYRNQVNAWMAQGGNQAKVAQQSLQNKALQDTIARLRQQLGG